jgi:hypothetical protein
MAWMQGYIERTIPVGNAMDTFTANGTLSTTGPWDDNGHAGTGVGYVE